jgi:hypothetical protein
MADYTRKMKITIYSNDDIKKSGGFKKKNNILVLDDDKFIQYILDNQVLLTKGYIDYKGFISNGLFFKCEHKGIIIGVTGIIERVNKILTINN